MHSPQAIPSTQDGLNRALNDFSKKSIRSYLHGSKLFMEPCNIEIIP